MGNVIKNHCYRQYNNWNRIGIIVIGNTITEVGYSKI